MTRPHLPGRPDRLAGALAVALVAAAALTGAALHLAGRPVHASAAPLFAHWVPHAGPGTPAALVVAVVVVRHAGARIAWRRLLVLGWAASVAWILSLAMVDGWRRGVTGRLTTPHEYLSEVDRVTDVPAMLRSFTDGIVTGWTTHVAGHPPGALLTFVLTDRLGLGATGAALLCVLAGALVAVAVPVTVREAAGEEAARAAWPFVVLFPGAVWIGVSADGLFAGVTATGIALLAVRGRARNVAGGALLGFGLYLSYGLVLLAPLALAVTAARRRFAALGWGAAGVVAVVAAFTVAGFRWWEGYELVQVRYYAGVAADRPYAYWVWANLAALVLCAGPAVAPILRRCVTAGRPALLTAAAAIAIVLADLSGLSKAETERIWLPFAVWLPAAAALLPAPDRRFWLVVQAVTALLVNHLLLTTW